MTKLSTASTVRRFIPLTALVALACGGAAVYGPVTPAPTSPEELSTVHDDVRVAGLEDRRFDHDTYWRAVDPYLGREVSSRVAGESAEGREIRHLTFGRGPTAILLWSQMHGNESTASMSLADIIRFFDAQPNHPLARRIAEGATIHMIPMLNPDGAERFQRRNAQGIDVNRDARRLQTPEGQLLKAVRDQLDPEFGFNLRGQTISPRLIEGLVDKGRVESASFDAFSSLDELERPKDAGKRQEKTGRGSTLRPRIERDDVSVDVQNRRA